MRHKTKDFVMRKKKEKIEMTDKEEELMRIFWNHGPMFVREIVELYPEPRPHFNTLSTFVRNLEQKGFVSHEAVGGSFPITPWREKRISAERLSARLSRTISATAISEPCRHSSRRRR